MMSWALISKIHSTLLANQKRDSEFNACIIIAIITCTVVQSWWKSQRMMSYTETRRLFLICFEAVLNEFIFCTNNLPATSHEPCQPYPAPGQAPVTQSQKLLGNNDNSNNQCNNKNKNNNNNNKNKRERRAGENTKTLRKLIRSPQTVNTVRLWPRNGTRIK